jgi:lactate permease
LQTNAVLAVPALNLRFPLLYTPGFCVLLGAVSAALCLRVDRQQLQSALGRAWRQFVPAGAAIVFFLGTAQVMRSAGMVSVLGETVAALGGNYCWAAPWLAALGGWLTGSNTGSNALFALLQQKAADSAGLSSGWLVAAQNAAGSHAAMVSPTRTILACTAAGSVGAEGKLLGAIGPVVLGAIAVIMGLLVFSA